MNKAESCIIVFAKAPIPGHVKTRLAAELDTTAAVGLYRSFVSDIIDKVSLCGHCLKVFYDPPGSLPMMKAWLGNCHDFFLQNGSDLGRKMADAFQTLFESGTQKAVLMGTDFPDLSGKIISDALSALESHDAVIGPTFDGGYYMIGFRKNTFLPAVFEQKPWGTADVFQQTLNDFELSGTTVYQLPKWRDIDVYEDLKALIEVLKHDPGQARHTYSILKKIGLIEK